MDYTDEPIDLSPAAEEAVPRKEGMVSPQHLGMAGEALVQR